MTPFLLEITKQLLIGPEKRTFVDKGGVLAQIDNVHPFECSEVAELAQSLVQGCKSWEDFYQRIDVDLIFLPAPKTWIEFRIPDYGRFGFLIIKEVSEKKLYFCSSFSDGLIGSMPCNNLESFYSMKTPSGKTLSGDFIATVCVMLTLINQPKIVGRKIHQPHKGMAKAIRNAKGHNIAHPFKAWTEIKLDICPTQDVSDEPGFQARLTGQKALHFCRAHLRLWMGKLIFVKAHWRGNAALGEKRSRYKLRDLTTPRKSVSPHHSEVAPSVSPR